MESVCLSYLMWQLWYKIFFGEKFLDDTVTKAKAGARLRLTAQSLQQPVVSAPTKDGSQLPRPVSPLKHNSCRSPSLHLVCAGPTLLQILTNNLHWRYI